MLPFHTLLTSSNFSNSLVAAALGMVWFPRYGFAAFSPLPVRSMDFTTTAARVMNSTNLALVLVSASQLRGPPFNGRNFNHLFADRLLLGKRLQMKFGAVSVF